MLVLFQNLLGKLVQIDGKAVVGLHGGDVHRVSLDVGALQVGHVRINGVLCSTDFGLSPEGQQALIDLHVIGIKFYLSIFTTNVTAKIPQISPSISA